MKLEITDLPFFEARLQSEKNRNGMFLDFRAIYERDYDEIIRIIKREYENKPFTAATLDSYYYIYRDEVQKILNRQTAGIYTQMPTRELYIAEKKTDELFPEVLQNCQYHARVKESFRKSKFFNTVIGHVVWRDNKLAIDILTGAECAVITGADYLQIKEIKVQRTNEDGEIYYAIWTEEQHYIWDGKNKVAIEGNPDMINPYMQMAAKLGISPLPFVVLRAKEGLDFWGEPNWALFTHQLDTIMNLTDNANGAYLQKFPPLWANDIVLPEKTTLSPGQAFTTQTGSDGIDKQVRLEFLPIPTDWNSLRENEDYKRKALMNSEGIPEGSASVQGGPKQVGAKTIDELELYENREDAKETLYNFELALMNCVRMVHNTYASKKLNEAGYFDMTFSEEKPAETVDDKNKRRDHEKKSFLKTEIDFAMEDFEIAREEAVKRIARNKGLPETTTEEELIKSLSQQQTAQKPRLIDRLDNPQPTL